MFLAKRFSACAPYLPLADLQQQPNRSHSPTWIPLPFQVLADAKVCAGLRISLSWGEGEPHGQDSARDWLAMDPGGLRLIVCFHVCSFGISGSQLAMCVCVCLSLPYLKVRGSSLTNRLQLAPTDNHVCSIQNVPFPAWCRRERPVWKLGLRVPTRKSLCQRILYEGSLLNAGSEPKRGEKIQKLRRRGGHVRCSYRGGLRRGGP